jgi:radical SAM protein with 4Fe4S-binding SPASM domain
MKQEAKTIRRWTARLRSSAALLLRRPQAALLPQEVIIEVTTACNLACPMCARTALANTRQRAPLSLSRFASLLDRLPAAVERVALAGLGEPLLDRDLPDMVGLLSARSFHSVLYTNGTLLEPDLSERLVAAGLSTIIIPIDGATAGSYETYRKNATYEITVRNVRALLKAKKRQRSALFVELQMLRLPGLEAEIGLWRRQWSLPGIDSLRVKPDHMGVGAAEGAPGTRSSGHGICPMPWRGPATVDIDGQVYPCCVQSPENRILGNLFRQPLEEIWNAAAAIELRRGFVESRAKLSTCSGCLIPIPPAPVSVVGGLLSPALARRILSRVEPLISRLGAGT